MILVHLEETELQDLSEKKAPQETLVQVDLQAHVVLADHGGREAYKAPLEVTGGTEVKEHVDLQVK